MSSTNIIAHTNGHARVIAGPGTGKTENLIRLVIELLEQRIDPNTILVITFTRAAAKELLDRIMSNENLDENSIPIIKNIHAYSLKILMSDQYRSKLELPLTILDDWEEKNLLIKLLKLLLNSTGRNGNKSIKEKLSYYEAGWNRLTYDHSDWIRDDDLVFDLALSALKKVFGFTLRGELNFILKNYLDSNPLALNDLNLKYVLVDEYQDLNPCEHAILKHFKNSKAIIFCFGDDDQSIYSFRQAAPKGIIDFKNDYQPCTDYPLNICYRCTQNLLDLSLNLIRRTTIDRIDKIIKSRRKQDCYIKCYQFSDGGSELFGIIKIIERLTDIYGLNYRDILILVPSKKYGRGCANILQLNDIPVEDWLTVHNPLDLDNIRKLYSILRLKRDNNDQVALWTWLTLYKGIGDTLLFKLLEQAIDLPTSFLDTIQYIIKRDNVGGRFKTILINCMSDLDNIKRYLSANNLNILTLLDYLSNFQLFSFSENELDFISNLLYDYPEDSPISDFLLQKMVKFRLEPSIIPEEDKIRIMTMHRAKGLSSKAVIIPFQEDEVMLSKVCESDKAAIEERRRLFYVSITRAKDYLFLTHARKRVSADAYTSEGRSRNRKRSRFIDDMDFQSENGEEFIASNN